MFDNHSLSPSSFSITRVNTHFIEISLEEELLEDVDELWQGGKDLLEVLDELRGADAVHHVEADVHLDVRPLVGQFNDGDLKTSVNCQFEQCHSPEFVLPPGN